MRFTFLESTRPSPLVLVREMKIDVRTRNVSALLCVMIGLLAFAEGIEQVRIAQARTTEQARATRLANDEQHMVEVRAAYNVVFTLSSAAQLVRETQRSGDHEAEVLTDVASSLPTHLWLTAFRQDANVITIEGKAASYALIGDAMQRLAQTRTVDSPHLLSSGIADNAHPDEINYQIRLRERTR